MTRKVFFVNYASGAFERNRKYNNVFTRYFVRPHKILSYNLKDLQSTYEYQNNPELFSQTIGGGYWAWKPLFILKAMKAAEPGDIILYQDCGIGFRYKNVIRPKAIVNYALTYGAMPGVAVPEYGINKNWTHKLCFSLMNCDTDEYHQLYQTEAAISCWVVNEKNMIIVKEWLKFCLDFQIISNDGIALSQHLGYAVNGHRHDQSVLSNLVGKYSLKPYWQNENSGHLFKSLSYLELNMRHSLFSKIMLSLYRCAVYLNRRISR